MEKRLFIGLPFSNAKKDYIREFIEESEIEEIKWIPKKNYHLTLFFIGNFKESDVPELKKVLRKLFTGKLAFSLEPDQLQLFPVKSSPRMVWLSFKEDPHFTKMVIETAKVIHENFPYIENKVFKKIIPHLTLARFNLGKVKDLDLGQMDLPEKITFEKVLLYESQLTPEGANYFPLWECELAIGREGMKF